MLRRGWRKALVFDWPRRAEDRSAVAAVTYVKRLATSNSSSSIRSCGREIFRRLVSPSLPFGAGGTFNGRINHVNLNPPKSHTSRER